MSCSAVWCGVVYSIRLPDTDEWTRAPPSSSCVTVSWVTVFTTLGPVTNMYDVLLTWYIKLNRIALHRIGLSCENKKVRVHMRVCSRVKKSVRTYKRSCTAFSLHVCIIVCACAWYNSCACLLTGQIRPNKSTPLIINYLFFIIHS